MTHKDGKGRLRAGGIGLLALAIALGSANAARAQDSSSDVDFTGEGSIVYHGRLAAAIDKYATQLHAQYVENLQKAALALTNVGRAAGESISIENADPDLLGALASEAMDIEIDRLVEKGAEFVPYVREVKSLMGAVLDELRDAGTRAARNDRSERLSDWIDDQTRLIGDRYDDSTEDDLHNIIELDVAQELKKKSQSEVATELEEAAISIQQVRFSQVALEQTYIEQWINANYVGGSGSGFIDVRFEIDGDGKSEPFSFSLASVSLKMPNHNEMERKINRLVGHSPPLQGRDGLLALHVRKKICVVGDNFVPGGRSAFCGLIGPDNDVLETPTRDQERRFFEDFSSWRRYVRNFQ